MIAFKDERTVNFTDHENLNTSFVAANHNPQAMPEKIRAACCVCMLEEGIQNVFRRENRLSDLAEIMRTSEDSIKHRKGLFSTRNLASCSCNNCSLVAHSVRVNSNNFIFKHTELQGLTSFQSAHHPLTNGLWISNPEMKHEKKACSWS